MYITFQALISWRLQGLSLILFILPSFCRKFSPAHTIITHKLAFDQNRCQILERLCENISQLYQLDCVPGEFSINYRIVSNLKHQQLRRHLIEVVDVIRFLSSTGKIDKILVHFLRALFFITVAPYQHDTRNLSSDTPNLAHLPASGRGQIIIIIHIVPYNEQLILKQLFASPIGTQNAATFIRRQNLNNGLAEGSVAPVRTYQSIRARGATNHS